MAKPRMSRSASAAPRSPATVEKRTRQSVFLPTCEKIEARVYLVMSCVTVKVPKAPDPLACMRRSGITSRSKWASFSRYHTSCSMAGPRTPAVWMFWLSAMGFPFSEVSLFLSISYCFLSACRKMPDRFMIEFHIVVIQSKNIAIRIGVASLGICFFCEERTVGVNFSGNRLCFSRIWKISLYLSR